MDFSLGISLAMGAQRSRMSQHLAASLAEALPAFLEPLNHPKPSGGLLKDLDSFERPLVQIDSTNRWVSWVRGDAIHL